MPQEMPFQGSLWATTRNRRRFSIMASSEYYFLLILSGTLRHFVETARTILDYALWQAYNYR
jgi:hypothetical protein